MARAQTKVDRFGQTLAHISLSGSWNNFWRRFAVLPLSPPPPWPAIHAWSLPESCLLSPASFQLTVDSAIELKRGECSHSLRSFRRSRATFLQVEMEKKKRRRKPFSSPTFHFLFSFIQQLLLGAAKFYVKVWLGFKGDQDTGPSSRIHSLAVNKRHAHRVIES